MQVPPKETFLQAVVGHAYGLLKIVLMYGALFVASWFLIHSGPLGTCLFLIAIVVFSFSKFANERTYSDDDY